MAQEDRKSSPALIAAAWIIVLVPTLWGLTFTVGNAMKIFNPPPVAAPAAGPAAAPAGLTPAPAPR